MKNMYYLIMSIDNEAGKREFVPIPDYQNLCTPNYIHQFRPMWITSNQSVNFHISLSQDHKSNCIKVGLLLIKSPNVQLCFQECKSDSSGSCPVHSVHSDKPTLLISAISSHTTSYSLMNSGEKYRQVVWKNLYIHLRMPAKAAEPEYQYRKNSIS